MKDLDLDRLVESGDIVEYVYEDEGYYSELLTITLPSGKKLSIGSRTFGNSSCLIINSW